HAAGLNDTRRLCVTLLKNFALWVAIGQPARFDDFPARYGSNPPFIDHRVIAIALYIDGGFDRRAASADLLELVIVVSLTKVPDLAKRQRGFRWKRSRRVDATGDLPGV